MNIKRAYKFRFYPTIEQEQILNKTFGCARFVYNYMLKVRTDGWYERQERIGYHETSELLTELKKKEEFTWLNEVTAVPIQQSLRHLHTGFINFWRHGTKYPKAKKRKSKQSATYASSAFNWNGNKRLKLAKMSEPLNIRWSRRIPKHAKLTTVTVTNDSAGRYFVSMLFDDVIKTKPKKNKKIGIDLGLTSFITTSDGDKVNSSNFYRKYEKRLAKAQRKQSRKIYRSNNWNKASLAVNKIYAKITDSRKDFSNKLSTKLINENQVIVVESLAICNMKRNHNLAKSISDASWSEFIRQLEYKANWYGRELIKIDRFYPSSKRCNDCGYTLNKLFLDTRKWICPQCNIEHDRDINAAKNILAAGLAVSVCGEKVKPELAC